MSMVWLIILALVASPDGHSCRPDREPGRLMAVSVDKGASPAPSRARAIGRNVGHRRCSAPWSAGGLDEFDTEEWDETWTVNLDLLASVPVEWLAWAWPRSLIEPNWIDGLDPSPPSCFPLRC